jgi:hypothetical protein
MAGKDPRDKEFEAERRRRLARLTEIQRDTAAEVKRLLEEAAARIRAELAGTTTDFQSFQLPIIEQSIRRALNELGDGLAVAGRDGMEKTWRAGIDLVDKPLEAAGVRIAGVLPEVDLAQLMAMRTFMTGKMRDVALEAANRINTQLGLAMVGAATPADAVGAIAGILEEGGRARAITVVRTELGRAFSAATQQRQEQASQHLPGLRKQWRRSGKVHSRVTHDAADGQVVDVDEPFLVGGEKLMYPRDPKASARNTVNCGCVQLPYMADWEVRHPGAKPFTPEETAGSQMKRRLAGVQAQAFDTWAQRLATGKMHATGSWETAGGITDALLQRLEVRGIKPATAEIAISDRQIRHMTRDVKKDAGKALPARVVRRIPEKLAAPKAVLLARKAKTPTLLYVFEVEGETRLGKLPVKLRDIEKRAAHRTHNWVATGGLVQRDALVDENIYEVLEGKL